MTNTYVRREWVSYYQDGHLSVWNSIIEHCKSWDQAPPCDYPFLPLVVLEQTHMPTSMSRLGRTCMCTYVCTVHTVQMTMCTVGVEVCLLVHMCQPKNGKWHCYILLVSTSIIIVWYTFVFWIQIPHCTYHSCKKSSWPSLQHKPRAWLRHSVTLLMHSE